MAQKRCGKPRKAKKVGDLEARANRAGAVKGGLVRSSAVILPYIEQNNVVAAAGPSAGGHVKVVQGATGAE
jgi:hypothetical protein